MYIFAAKEHSCKTVCNFDQSMDVTPQLESMQYPLAMQHQITWRKTFVQTKWQIQSEKSWIRLWQRRGMLSVPTSNWTRLETAFIKIQLSDALD